MTWKRYFSLGAVSKAGIMLAVFQLLSRLVGLWRDRVMASHFGASDILDAYYISFSIPDFIFNLLAAGAISAAFIPVFIEYQQKKLNYWGIANSFLNFLLLGVLAAAAILFWLAPSVISLIAPGFSAEKKDLAVFFTRVMLLSPVIFSVSAVAGSILQIYNRFFYFALAPIMYNFGIIFGATVLVPKFGPLGLAEGVVLGAFLHLLTQWPAAWKTGWRWQWSASWRRHRVDHGIRKIFILTVPRMIGLAGLQIYTIIQNALATTLGIGAVAVFNFANNLQYLPIALVGISSAVAAFPTLSREALREDKKEFIARIENYIKKILLLTVPFSFLFFFLREEVVRIILHAGQFTAANVSSTVNVFGFFLIGVFSQSLIPVLSRSFYALQNTKTPVTISLISILFNTALAFYFVKFLGLGVSSLALAFSLAGIFNATLLLIFLKKFVANFNFKTILNYFFRLVIASDLMFFVLIVISRTGFLAGAGFTSDLWRIISYTFLALFTLLTFFSILRIRISNEKHP